MGFSTKKLKKVKAHSFEKDTHRIAKYGEFSVNERGKIRKIKSLKMGERIFQHSLCDNFLTDDLKKHFIYDNGASLKHKGLRFARDRLKTYLHKAHNKWNNYYVLQIDVKSYYDSINHDVLKTIMSKHYDGRVYKYLEDVIDSYGDCGVGAGSQIIQNLALEYLNGFDHFMKEKQKCKFYVRYNDDVIILLDDREKLKEIKAQAENYLLTVKLKANPKKTKIYPIKQGICFLGFHFYITDTGRVFVKTLADNIKRNKKKYRRMIQSGLDADVIWKSFNCWMNHAKYANSYYTIQNMKKYIEKQLEGVQNDLCRDKC